jgi:fructose-1,6-bisphosphatase/inositol monophosphatase family enzyme
MTTFTRHDAAAVGQILAETACAEIMPRFSGAMASGTREKSSAFDVVTDADEAAEREISRRLLALYPGALVIGEEAAGRDPGLLARIATAALAFIVDPIDGTKNFSSGVPLFGVMVSATVHGEVAMGVIHDPVCGDTSFAVRGAGAWRQRDAGRQGGELPAERLRVAAPAPLERMHVVAGTNFMPEPMRSTVLRNLPKLGMNFWMRCAAHEYRMAAAGHCHALVYNKLMPWDHAAGWLIHQEAGGYSAHFDGSSYAPGHLGPDYRPTACADSLWARSGSIFLTGTQSLVRLMLMQRQRDAARGLNTQGFISGYRGSPLGMVDQAVWKAGKQFEKPGCASCPPSTRSSAPRQCWARSASRPTPSAPATACSRSGTARGPGVDRAGDALKHGNAYGASPHGGVLMVAGDDHGCVSSSMPHQSDQAFQSWHAPIVSPASVAEYLEFGLYGWQLSRFSGNWVGFTALSEVVESASTVDLDLVNARVAAWQDATRCARPPATRRRPAACTTAGPTCRR